VKRAFHYVPLAYSAFLLAPLYWLVVMSLQTPESLRAGFAAFPANPTLGNYALILGDLSWSMGYLNAAVYVLMNVAISVTVAVPAAYAFSRYDFFGARPLFFGFLIFRMMAPAILLVPFVQIFSDLGLFDTHIAVALAHCAFNVPLAVWILEGFITAVPREMDESARVDGHSLPGFFMRILLPQIAPGIAVTAFFCFMFSWIEFLISNGLTAVAAKPIGGIMTRAGGVLGAYTPLVAAASVIGLVPGLLLIIVMKKHLARGFSMGRIV
jgi:glycerol transport system permease protein